METFSEIFQAMIQDHGQRPRHFGELHGATHEAEGVNPLTGDQLTIQFEIDAAQMITAAKFTGKASSLATTSASVMMGELIGKSVEEARKLIDNTLLWFSGSAPIPSDLTDNEFSVLLEIRNVPHRVRCASLAWKTAASALLKK